MQKLQTIDADALLYEPLEKPQFVVDGLIPTGLILFCGAQKIGKSWLMLKLCLCVSQGLPLWEMSTTQGDVLYLCLEDTFSRIQDRLFQVTDEANGRLHFAVASDKLSDGLIVQMGTSPLSKTLPTGIPFRLLSSTISENRMTVMCSTRYLERQA